MNKSKVKEIWYDSKKNNEGNKKYENKTLDRKMRDV